MCRRDGCSVVFIVMFKRNDLFKTQYLMMYNLCWVKHRLMAGHYFSSFAEW